MSQQKADILAGLQADILRLQGFKTIQNTVLESGLGPMKYAFPNATFPLGAIHEFVSARPEETAATIGFLNGMLNILTGNTGAVLWISSSRILYPPALKNFGLDPDRFIFIDVQKRKRCTLGIG